MAKAKTIKTSGLTVAGATGSDTVDPTTTVKVLVKYPADYKGPRFMEDGSIQPVAKDAAELFVSQGIASYVEDAEIEVLTEEAE